MYNWSEKRKKRAFVALESGEVFRGYSIGAPVDSFGEAVFNTGMSGYQEIVSDPSYAGQLVTLTAPEIGNYGTNAADMESRKLFLGGLIIHELNSPSNFRSERSLDDLLKSGGIPAIAGVDTRRLTLILRNGGTKKAYIHCSDDEISPEEGVKRAQQWQGLDGQDYAAKVSVEKPYLWNEAGDFHVVALDFGIKYGQLRDMANYGMKLTVVPAQTTAQEILKCKPDGVFFSNGPADPQAVTYAIDCAKELTGKIPLMGICLGHQILGISQGCDCEKLKFGHHGINHPVKNLITGAVEITSQNHNYSLKADSLPSALELTHINLNDNTVEGIRHKTEPLFSVQYHPEAAPGPNDSKYLFDEFKRMMAK